MSKVKQFVYSQEWRLLVHTLINDHLYKWFPTFVMWATIDGLAVRTPNIEGSPLRVASTPTIYNDKINGWTKTKYLSSKWTLHISADKSKLWSKKIITVQLFKFENTNYDIDSQHKKSDDDEMTTSGILMFPCRSNQYYVSTWKPKIKKVLAPSINLSANPSSDQVS